MNTTIEQPDKSLVPIEIANPSAIFKAGGTDAIVAAIEAKARSFDLDISTERGRAEMKSVARKIASSKTLLDEAGKNFVAEIKEQAKIVDNERKRMRERLDALKDEIRKPLTDWEQVDERRIGEHERVLALACSLVEFDRPPPVAFVEHRLADLEQYADRKWEEFAERAAKVFRNARSSLRERLVDAKKAEQEAAELARLRAEAAERAQRERDERVAAEAADKARKAAERIAFDQAEKERRITEERERQATLALQQAKAKVEAEREQDRRAKEAAETRARKAEEDRKNAETAKRQAETQAKLDREADAKRAEERSKREAADALKREQIAIEQERTRVRLAREQGEREERARIANLENRAQIESEIVTDAEFWLEEELARDLIEAINQGKIRHLSINY